MTLAEGARLGSYEVRGLLGAGGMGEVYRARDTKLGREVAIKVLPEHFARDEARLGRIEREARILASLNHPNIASLFGFEEADGVRFLIMELVPGDSLADRVQAGPLPVREALDVGRQVAEALEEAHARGVIHRDLKPANIKVTPEGRVKVLDFGLAKALDDGKPADAETDTVTRSGTSEGVILGTAAYMSPEQARGQALDARSDIWSFGCVLYETLTARRAFSGPTLSDTLVAVLNAETDFGQVPESTPAGVRNLLRRCLERDRRKRLQSIGDARVELEEALAGPAAGSGALAPGAPASVITAKARWPIVTALAIGIALGGFGVSLWARREPPARPWFPKRLSLPLPPGTSLLLEGLSVSPDGMQIAYVAADAKDRRQVYAQGLADLEPRPVRGTQGAGQPTFSPDGKWLAYSAEGKLKKVPASGGEPTTLCALPPGAHPAWVKDGVILFRDEKGGTILRVSALGGSTEVLAKMDGAKGEVANLEPDPLPDGKTVMLTIGSSSGPSVAALSLETGQVRTILSGARWPHYVPTGHLLYAPVVTGSSLRKWVVAPFDPSRLEVTGPPVGVLDDLRVGDYEPQWVTPSYAGLLAYIAGPVFADVSAARSIDWVDRQGKRRTIGLPAKDVVDFSPALSPDGKRMAAVAAGDHPDIWIADLGSLVWTRLTFEGVNNSPVWSPDGRRIAFAREGTQSGRFDLYWIASDGSGSPELIVKLDGRLAFPMSFSPDGRTLAFGVDTADPNSSGPRAERTDLFLVSLDGDRQPKRFMDSRFSTPFGVFSPDGRWMAYVSNESGEYQVFVRSSTGSGRKWGISPGGGLGPAWSPSGKELFYQERDRIMVVPVSSASGDFEPGIPRVLLSGLFTKASEFGRPFEVPPDGQRFLLWQGVPAGSGPAPLRLAVIPDWFEEVKARVRQAGAK